MPIEVFRERKEIINELSKTKGENMVQIESKGENFFIHGIKELEGCQCYPWGEDLFLVVDEEDGRYLVNKATGKSRKISEPGKLVGFSDEEIDLEAIEKLENSHNARLRLIKYGGISRWNDCTDGLITLCWTLYPDGRYFADEDGYGMEDNDELTVYCVMNDNLEVVKPFAPR